MDNIALYLSLACNVVLAGAVIWLKFFDVAEIVGTDGCTWPECRCCQACGEMHRDPIEAGQQLADLDAPTKGGGKSRTLMTLALLPLLAGCAAEMDREYAHKEIDSARHRIAATCGADASCRQTYAELEAARIRAELQNRQARREAIGRAFAEGMEEYQRNRPRQTRCTTIDWSTRCTTY